MAEPIIQVKNVKVFYNQGKSNEVRSLDDVSVRIYPKEYVIFFGPSGCGKSTLLYTISGLQAPTEGQVFVLGKELTKMSKKEMVEMHQIGIGMVFQAFYLIPSLTILDNVCLPKVFRGESVSKRREAGVKLLHRFSIEAQANKFPSELSGGQKQRVSIARSLVNDPQIILADEPVGNLDSVSAKNVLQILKELNEIDKKTIILVTHAAEHLYFADRVVFMKDGKVIREEVHTEKRPVEELGGPKETEFKVEEFSDELKILMRTFKNLSIQQAGTLLVPYKSNQLLTHVLSEISQEQIEAAGNFLKELLFKNIDVKALERNLDLDYDRGGAGWHSARARTFADRVDGIMKQVNIVAAKDDEKSVKSLTEYLTEKFHLKIEGEIKKRFASFLNLRIKNKIDRVELQRSLDTAKILGGVGLHKTTAERVSREVEVVMLLKFGL